MSTNNEQKSDNELTELFISDVKVIFYNEEGITLKPIGYDVVVFITSYSIQQIVKEAVKQRIIAENPFSNN